MRSICKSLFIAVLLLSPTALHAAQSRNLPAARGVGAGGWRGAIAGIYHSIGRDGIGNFNVPLLSRLMEFDFRDEQLDKKIDPLVRAMRESWSTFAEEIQLETPESFATIGAPRQAELLRIGAQRASNRIRAEARELLGRWKSSQPLDEEALEEIYLHHREYLDDSTRNDVDQAAMEFGFDEEMLDDRDRALHAMLAELEAQVPTRERDDANVPVEGGGVMESRSPRERGLRPAKEDLPVDAPNAVMANFDAKHRAQLIYWGEKGSPSSFWTWGSVAIEAAKQHLHRHYLNPVRRVRRLGPWQRQRIEEARAEIKAFEQALRRLNEQYTPLANWWYQAGGRIEELKRKIDTVEEGLRRRQTKALTKAREASDTLERLHEERSYEMLRPLSEVLSYWQDQLEISQRDDDSAHEKEVRRIAAKGSNGVMPVGRAYALWWILGADARLAREMAARQAIGGVATMAMGSLLIVAGLAQFSWPWVIVTIVVVLAGVGFISWWVQPNIYQQFLGEEIAEAYGFEGKEESR